VRSSPASRESATSWEPRSPGPPRFTRDGASPIWAPTFRAVTSVRGRSAMKYHRLQSVGFCDPTYVRGRPGMKYHRLSRWDSLSQPTFEVGRLCSTTDSSRWDSVSQPNPRGRSGMKYHRLSRWDSVSQPNPRGAIDTLARFCRPSRPVLLFSNGSRGYALRARPWLPSAAPAAL
jgi:hypothetical protein